MNAQKITHRLSPARRLRLSAILCVFLLFIVAGCNSSRTGEDAPGGASPEAAVIIRLKWLFNAGTAGELWALEEKGFERHGLRQVELREGGAEHNAIKEVELGRASFGVASADQIIRAVEKGSEIVVLAQIFQANPLQWIFVSSRANVEAPADLAGKDVGITYGGNDEAIFMALLRRYGLSEKDIRLHAVHYDYTPFWKGEVNLWPVYRNVEGMVLARRISEQGDRPGFFDPSAFGIRFVANSLFTSRAIYQARPDLVRRFTDAVTEGWQEATNPKNRARAAEIVHMYDRDTPVETIAEQLAASERLVKPDPARKVGSIDHAGWEETMEIMLTQGLINRRVDLKALLAGPPP